VDTAFVNGLFRKFPRIRESLEYVLSELRLGGVKLLKLSKQVLSFFVSKSYLATTPSVPESPAFGHG